MGTISLSTRHGRISGWEAKTHVEPRGGIIVVQETFGVNPHIRHVADRFANYGYRAVAPALFDLVAPGTELGYDEAGVERGHELAERLGFNGALDGVRAAYDYLDADGLRVMAVGFGWGGTVAFIANTRFGCPSVSYYGTQTEPFLRERPKAPMLLHFAENDPLTPPESVQAHREHLPGAEIHLWPAGHGFNCDERADYSESVSQQAFARTLAFIQKTFRR